MKSHLAWNYIDQKKSINACTAFELNISEIPDTRKMSQMMEKLSQFYPGLKSTFEDGPFGSVRLVENKDHNIFVRDKVYDNLEHFTVDEANFNFKRGTRLYYVAACKFANGKIGLAFNAHHTIADAVVHEAITEAFLAAILRNKELDLEAFKAKKSFTIAKKSKPSILNFFLFICIFSYDYFSAMKKLPKLNSGSKTLFHRIEIDKLKMPQLSLARSNSYLCASFMKAFGEVMGFKGAAVKTIHMVNVRTEKYLRNSPNFARSMASALTVNQRVDSDLKTVADKNLYYIRRSFYLSIAHLTSDLQYYFFKFVDFLRLGHVCHIGFSNTEKIHTDILDSFEEIDDVIGFPSLGQSSPYMSVIVFDKRKYWGINVSYLESYFTRDQLEAIEARMKSLIYEQSVG